MKISEIIIPWYKLASGETVDQSNIFFRFIAAWIAFNGIYSTRYDDQPNDSRKIEKFSYEPEMFERHKTLLANDKKYLQAVEYIASKGVIDSKYPDDPYKIEKFENLGQVMRCIYQIRCNLFHGEKELENPRDKGLVEAAYTIVSMLIEPWLDPDIIESWSKPEPVLSAHEQGEQDNINYAAKAVSEDSGPREQT
jgi:hypothetical protein